MAIKTAKELAVAAEAVAKNYKTLYVMGCFGAPMNENNKARYTENHKYNKAAVRTAMIQAASTDTFGFDCVNLIKGLLWGWNGDKAKTYGGAKYKANDVPDIGADAMIGKCSDVSADFSKIEVGEVVHKSGHIGIYIGDGLVVECTPSWDNCVQITACNCDKKGYNRRNWTQHGKLPYVEYSDQEKPHVTYQVYCDGRWFPEVTGFNEVNSSGYAGVFGKAISGVRVKISDATAVDVWLHNKIQPKSMGVEQVDCIAMRAETCHLRYRVHIVGGHWLPWVTGFDMNDEKNGYAGVRGKSIDAVQIDVVEKR